MGTFLASLIILAFPLVAGAFVTWWLWKWGIFGRVLLVGVFMCGAVQAHSIIYPEKQLKENYARVIG